jgi:RNA-directed DNA polymerase
VGWFADKLRSWLGSNQPKSRGVDELAERLGLSAAALHGFQPTYREVFIPKRSGGERRLHVPDPATKGLQRALLRRVLGKLSAHSAACGFEAGRSIVHNALPHVGQAVVIRLDIVDFFPATSSVRVENYFRGIGWNAEAAGLLLKLTTHEGGLPQGAPTSPRLSNLVNYLVDVKLTKLAARSRGRYTRYADDLTFSFPKDYPRRMRAIVQRTRRILKAQGYLLHRRKKFSIRRRHQQQVVTGLVVNVWPQLPRSVRRRLRAVAHYQRTSRPATLTPDQLAGWHALQKMIEQQAQSSRQ